MAGQSRECDPRIKVEWAKQHIVDLQLQISAFESRSHKILDDLDVQSGQQFHRVRLDEPIPNEIRLGIGDILHNLRVALDHLLYRIMPRGPVVAMDATTWIPHQLERQGIRIPKRTKNKGTAE